eukprot:CAMPEP_0118943828 /NCGR_PEP_ID=MMETSP1169-20130426/39139_1 /TAXON_ID=36882 /ORGANISM="Pyramimonas obovata, Strain CCMP722" /LENGTH=214 /DNA_ID=CAMNT_0006889177 /DNA_START=266 /DNA_END=908 /DNA_ORIENTATION=-
MPFIVLDSAASAVPSQPPGVRRLHLHKQSTACSHAMPAGSCRQPAPVSRGGLAPAFASIQLLLGRGQTAFAAFCAGAEVGLVDKAGLWDVSKGAEVVPKGTTDTTLQRAGDPDPSIVGGLDTSSNNGVTVVDPVQARAAQLVSIPTESLTRQAVCLPSEDSGVPPPNHDGWHLARATLVHVPSEGRERCYCTRTDSGSERYSHDFCDEHIQTLA